MTITIATKTTATTVHQTTFDLNKFTSCVAVWVCDVRMFCVAGFFFISSSSFRPLIDVIIRATAASSGTAPQLCVDWIIWCVEMLICLLYFLSASAPSIHWSVVSEKKPFFVPVLHIFFAVHIAAEQSLFHTISFSLSVGCVNSLGVQALLCIIHRALHAHSKLWQVRDTIRHGNRLPILMILNNSICFWFSFWHRIGIVQCLLFSFSCCSIWYFWITIP